MFKSSAVNVAAAVAILVGSSALQAQTAPDFKPRWEFIVNSGTVVPTGDQRDAIKRGSLTAAQLSYVIHPEFAVTASFGWGRTRDIANVGEAKLDMFTYDIGGEVRADRWMAGKTFSFSPFAGVGAGGRSYNYRSQDVDATHNVAGYASVGSEIGMGRRLKLRLEARDYVTGFKPLVGAGDAQSRNDVALMAGLRLKVR
jgi:hypothetical protein